MLVHNDLAKILHHVDAFVDDLLGSLSISGPPIDAIALAKALDVNVEKDDRQPGRGRLRRTEAHHCIYYRPEPVTERQQWTIAHELGEHFKAELLCRLGSRPDDADPSAGEMLANLFANHLLLPTSWFARDAARLDFDLLALKQRYATASHEVLAMRMLDLPQPCIISIIDNDKIHRRRSNAWPIDRRLHPSEQQCQQLVRARGEPSRLMHQGWTVSGWPVHQADWKREILRTEIETDC